MRKEFIPALNNFIELQSEYIHHEGTNDYTKEKIIIEEIVDKSGQKVDPVWERKWKEIFPGVATMEYEDIDQQRVRISQAACPVHIRFQEYHEYGEYDGSQYGAYEDSDFSPTQSRYYWVQYESGRKRLLKRALYLGIIALIAVSAMFIRGQYQSRLLRWELDQVEKVKIIYHGSYYHPGGGSPVVLTAEKNKGLISEVYNKIVSTKPEVHTNPDEDESQEGDPLFEINFTYKNGKSDRIESTETGKYIFRRLFGSGWIGGPREGMLAIVKKIQAKEKRTLDAVLKK